MEPDGLVVWYISVEHVRRMKSIWSGGSPLGMTSQGFVSGNKKKIPHAVYTVLSVQAHEQKQFTKLCNCHWLTEKKLAFTNQFTRQSGNAGLRIRILTDLLRVDLHSIKTAL
jgi:hypothetical protein